MVDGIKIRFSYMAVPEELEKRAYVVNPVKILILNADAPNFNGILGLSGRRLARIGVPFYFERALAEVLIRQGVAEEVKELPKKGFL